MNINKYIHRMIFLLIALTLNSCDDAFLDKKPDKALLVPITLKDFRALLDNDEVMNTAPAIGIMSADDYYTSQSGWQAYSTPLERNAAIWNSELYEGKSLSDWNTPYQQVFCANVVLEGLEQPGTGYGSGSEAAELKGAALFFRSFAFYQLASLFSTAYRIETAAAVPGIPLRLAADVNNPSPRASLEESYRQIRGDLQKAASLLPVQTAYKTRPSKAAAFAMLSRVCLAMEDYDASLRYADSCLILSPALLDYNGLNPALARPVTRFNAEVIFHASVLHYSFASSALTMVDSLVYRSYEPDDLRKTVFILDRGNKVYTFKGNYTGNAFLFGGLAADEVYLNRAECYARAGLKEKALDDLNALRLKRYKTGTYTPLTAAGAGEALRLVLTERRKELLFRDVRWADLKRLNKDPEYAKELKRVINGITYTLAPNDKRYVFAVPDNEIAGSNIPQNER